MKTLKIISLLFITVLAACASSKPDSKVANAEFKVKGVCAECEARIEKAALMGGVRSAEWDRYSEVIKIIYVPTKVTLDAIHKNIAGVGHDTDKMTASDATYNGLPKCCAYRDGAEKH